MLSITHLTNTGFGLGFRFGGVVRVPFQRDFGELGVRGREGEDVAGEDKDGRRRREIG